MSDMPETIRQLIARCEANETSFSNDDMSLALKFGELLWRRLERYGNGPMTGDAGEGKE